MTAIHRQRNRTDRQDDAAHAEVLALAVREGRSAILSRRLDGQTDCNDTGFVSGSADRQQLILSLPRDADLQNPLTLIAGEIVCVSFRRNRRKYFFASVVEEVDDGNVAVRWPDVVSRMQRRVHERVTPPSAERITVSLGDSNCPDGVLEDLSVGGFRVRASAPSRLANGALTTCLFGHPDSAGALELNARLRHVQHCDDGTHSLGFEFADLNATAEGRCRMAHLAAIAARFRQSNPTP